MITPQKISSILGTSTSYTGKILRHLAKAGMLKSHRGVSGGFTLEQPPETITCLDVYTACQDPGPNNYCDGHTAKTVKKTCGYHQAMFDIHQTFLTTLKKWTLADIVQIPSPSLTVSPNCKSRWTHAVDQRTGA